MTYMAKDKIVRTGTDIDLARGLVKVVRVALTPVTGTTAGGVLSWANPEGAKIIITRVVIDVTTAATAGSRTVEFGVANDGATSAHNLLDAAPVSTIAILDNITNKGTNGKTVAIVGSTQYVTGTASGSVAGLVGSAYIHYTLA